MARPAAAENIQENQKDAGRGATSWGLEPTQHVPISRQFKAVTKYLSHFYMDYCDRLADSLGAGAQVVAEPYLIGDLRTASPMRTVKASIMDYFGHILFHFERILVEHPDGSLEVHVQRVYVAPAYRGRGVSTNFWQAEIEQIRRVSDHPKTKVTIAAGYMLDPNLVGPDTQQHEIPPEAIGNDGYWAWASEKFQLDFAAADPLGLCYQLYQDQLPGSGDTSDTPEVSVQRTCLLSFLHQAKKYGLLRATGSTPLPTLFQQATAAVAQLTKPSHFLRFTVPGLEVLDGNMGPDRAVIPANRFHGTKLADPEAFCRALAQRGRYQPFLGRTYLRLFAPYWRGELLVHASKPAAAKQ